MSLLSQARVTALFESGLIEMIGYFLSTYWEGWSRNEGGNFFCTMHFVHGFNDGMEGDWAGMNRDEVAYIPFVPLMRR